MGWRPNSTVIKVLALVSAVIFVAALSAHLLTFSANPSITESRVDPIGVAIFIPFLCMILVMNSYTVNHNGQGRGLLERIRSSNEASRQFFRQLVQSCPLWARIASVALFLYVSVNFSLFIKVMQEGNPEQRSGRYYINNHGELVRELTEVEYRSLQAHQVRGFSGHWMIFSFLPLVYFAVVEPRQRALVAMQLLPKKVFCPKCNGRLILNLAERASGEFRCRHCGEEFMIDP